MMNQNISNTIRSLKWSDKDSIPTLTNELSDLYTYIKNPDDQSKMWVHIEIQQHQEKIDELSKRLNWHEMIKEDIIQQNEKPKLDLYGDFIVIISRSLQYIPHSKKITKSQVALILYPKLLISIVQDKNPIFDILIEQMNKEVTLGNHLSPENLIQKILKKMVNEYENVGNELEKELEKIELNILDRFKKNLVHDIHDVKRQVFTLRKQVLAHRDIIGEYNRLPNIDKDSRMQIYFQDAYDHATQLLDMTENQREMSISLMDLHLSTQNAKMNEVMKVLTVVSSIFIPLSFITGIYGMNFQRSLPDGREAPLNMPEIFQPYGYLTVLAFMVLITTGQIFYFKRKGWI